MAMKTAPKRKLVSMDAPSREAVRKGNDNDAAGKTGLLENGVDSKIMDICIDDIRLNPDNAIFVENDTEEDINNLAYDIEKNGLLHNLVVFEVMEKNAEGRGEKRAYMLLSGERRYKAIKKLYERGKFTYKTIKGCRVITTRMNETQKKALLYSANLQVRGGFSDESIRRKVVGEFVKCLQQAPYNMTEAEAKRFTKEIAPDKTKTLNKDLRIENDLNRDLLQMLDQRLLGRSECEIYVRFTPEQQQKIAEQYKKLLTIDCHGEERANTPKSHLEEKRDDIHNAFLEDLKDSLLEKYMRDTDAKIDAACAKFEKGYAELLAMSEAYEAALISGNEAVAEIKKEETLKRKETSASAEGKTFVQKNVKAVAEKIGRKIESRSYQKGLKDMTREARLQDIEALDDLIEKATRLRQMIEEQH